MTGCDKTRLLAGTVMVYIALLVSLGTSTSVCLRACMNVCVRVCVCMCVCSSCALTQTCLTFAIVSAVAIVL